MNLPLSFVRGMVAAVNPCGFVLLPTYLLYFLGVSNGEPGATRASVGRALAVSAAVSAGFFAVFVTVGAISDGFATTTAWIDRSKYVTALIGVALVVLGGAMLFGYRLPFTTPKIGGGAKDRTVRSMFVYGVAYAVASIGCTLPLFGAELFGTGRREGVFAGMASFGAYAFGMSMLVATLTVALAVANMGLLRVLRSGMQYVEMVAGGLVLASGLYLLWYFWRVDVLEEGDPLTDGVQRLQTQLGVFLQENWRVAFVLLMAVVGTATFYALASRRSRLSAQPDA